MDTWLRRVRMLALLALLVLPAVPGCGWGYVEVGWVYAPCDPYDCWDDCCYYKRADTEPADLPIDADAW